MKPESVRFFESLDAEIDKTDAKDNAFYARFREERLQRQELQFFCDQYFYYIRTFPQILAGLSHRVADETVRVELAKTIVSELGDGDVSKIHFELFKNAVAPLGVEISDWQTISHIAEANGLVDGIRELFLEGPIPAALGAHYTIEYTGLPMIECLYEGFRQYPGWTVESMEYFHIHMLVETEHVEWISSAVEGALPEDSDVVRKGALEMAHLLGSFWSGVDAAIGAGV